MIYLRESTINDLYYILITAFFARIKPLKQFLLTLIVDLCFNCLENFSAGAESFWGLSGSLPGGRPEVLWRRSRRRSHRSANFPGKSWRWRGMWGAVPEVAAGRSAEQPPKGATGRKGAFLRISVWTLCHVPYYYGLLKKIKKQQNMTNYNLFYTTVYFAWTSWSLDWLLQLLINALINRQRQIKRHS